MRERTCFLPSPGSTLTCSSFINLFAVQWYSESDFWLVLGKILLTIGLIIYIFITMLGGDPSGGLFGFRYWQNPSSFAELYYTGSLGRFLGFLRCLIQASFTIAGLVALTLTISLPSFLQVRNNAAVVLSWFVKPVTASQLINFSVRAFTYTRFKKACEAQGLDRNTLHCKSWGQPYLAWCAFTGCFIITFVGGYTVFLPGF